MINPSSIDLMYGCVAPNLKLRRPRLLTKVYAKLLRNTSTQVNRFAY